MKLIATYNFRFGHGNDEEIIRKGDEIHAMPTATMSQDEHRRSLIRQGAAKEVQE